MSKKLPIYVQLLLSLKDSERLHERIHKMLADSIHKYSVKKSPLHLTLCYFTDLPRKDYEKVVDEIYTPLMGTKHSLLITGIAVDKNCVALLVKTPKNMPVYPEGKQCHFTMLLQKKPPKYSNELIHRLKTKGVKAGERLEMFAKPISVSSQLNLVY